MGKIFTGNAGKILDDGIAAIESLMQEVRNLQDENKILKGRLAAFKPCEECQPDPSCISDYALPEQAEHALKTVYHVYYGEAK